MRCPFLREEQVKSCQAAPFRKSLARSTARVDLERCSSPDHASCPVAGQSHEAHPSPSRCPFLQESLVQFCAATPKATYVPWSSSPELRCGHGGHRYCELFAAASGTPVGRPDALAEAERTQEVAGVPMPGWLWYTANHLWLDPGDDGVCHLGIDAFVVQLVGTVEALAFLTPGGAVRPAVVLTVCGVDLTLVFPKLLSIVSANTRLRSSLDRLSADPYGLGWLFEARLPADEGRGRPVGGGPDPDGLRHGQAARDWMAHEVQRASAIVYNRIVSRRGGARLAADGGRFTPGLLHQLDREEILRLLADLFPLPESRRTP